MSTKEVYERVAGSLDTAGLHSPARLVSRIATVIEDEQPTVPTGTSDRLSNEEDEVEDVVGQASETGSQGMYRQPTVADDLYEDQEEPTDQGAQFEEIDLPIGQPFGLGLDLGEGSQERTGTTPLIGNRKMTFWELDEALARQRDNQAPPKSDIPFPTKGPEWDRDTPPHMSRQPQRPRAPGPYGPQSSNRQSSGRQTQPSTSNPTRDRRKSVHYPPDIAMSTPPSEDRRHLHQSVPHPTTDYSSYYRQPQSASQARQGRDHRSGVPPMGPTTTGSQWGYRQSNSASGFNQGDHGRPSAANPYGFGSASGVMGGGRGPPRGGFPITPSTYGPAGASGVNLKDTMGIDRILELFVSMLGDNPDEPIPGFVKSAKPPIPSKYNGKDDNEAFNVWLQQVLTYFDLHRIRGDQHEDDRLRMTAFFLEGDAGEWYQRTVIAGTSSSYQIVSYKEAIVAMYRRFIITDIYDLAERRFEAIRYDESKGGVSHLYDQMIHYKDRMFSPPTEYELNKKFVNALPRYLRYQLTVSRGLHVRTNTFAQFVNTAKVLEDATRALDSRGESSDMRKNDKKVSVSKPTHSSHKGKQREQYRPSSNTPSRFANNQRGVYPSGSNVRFDSRTQAPSASAQRREARPNNQGTPHTRPSASTGPPRPQSASAAPQGGAIVCFKCHKPGHKSNDPACPQYVKPRQFFAGRIVSEDEDDPTRDHDHGGEADDEGTESDTAEEQKGYDDPSGVMEGYPASDYERAISSGDETETALEMRAMIMMSARNIPQEPHENEPRSFAEAAHRTIQAFQMEATMPTRSIKNAWIYDPRVRRLKAPQDQPKRTLDTQRPLCAEVTINGVTAYTLFDSGCTTDSISPAFAYIAMADRVDLAEQMAIQLGTRGSRALINYGARANMVIGPVNETSHYFDVIDIDRYDVILGTPFFTNHDVVLDFKNRTITIGGKQVPVYTAVDEAEMLRFRYETRKRRIRGQIEDGLASELTRARVNT